ncbi:MAG: type IV pilus biogenesis/stability protein PilW [Methylovulum sp.]|uniref:type IV pilus biogenesis/stability protein PilW n=1 Tax=Methylovulum sp. TaxID=1916980 RepID=UPI00260CF5AF|nr:type IV pilus biogenesis/stability protein PilW [Methylovulum sp.]MDD2724643.1 type IV pilus biogenesis/stability protein PilW [Methylovulum sp.]MDD5123470.1 type IV pilus biogenesis/stability protein PilW [Methylovulum sp.]
MWFEIAKLLRLPFILSTVLVLAACATTAEKNEKTDTYLQLGVRYMNMNRLEIAKENLEKALHNDPGNVQVHNALAFLYEKIEKIPEAKAQYETALKLAPEDLGALNNYGRFLCEHDEVGGGMELLNKAIANLLNERPWMALTNAGLCQMKAGQKTRAKAYFKQALMMNANYAPALLEMQKISYQNREYWPAKAFLQRYLEAAQHTAESLWYGMQTERALGNDGLAQEYKNLLLENFPLSNEAKKVESVQ